LNEVGLSQKWLRNPQETIPPCVQVVPVMMAAADLQAYVPIKSSIGNLQALTAAWRETLLCRKGKYVLTFEPVVHAKLLSPEKDCLFPFSLYIVAHAVHSICQAVLFGKNADGVRMSVVERLSWDTSMLALVPWMLVWICWFGATLMGMPRRREKLTRTMTTTRRKREFHLADVPPSCVLRTVYLFHAEVWGQVARLCSSARR
jgi:hypothetical protein